MRTLKVYLHGATMGTPPRKTDHLRVKRGVVGGWSVGATRRNIAFLRSVEPESLLVDGDGGPLLGFAATFTLKSCPDSSDDWHKLRRAFLMRLVRMGLYRCHWVTEWQRRGVPHLHGAFWFRTPERLHDFIELNGRILGHWLDVAEPYGAGPRGQQIKPITDAIGWFKYLAKHAARGVQHYQRSSDSIPAGWKKTGRMWGHTGDWQLRDAMRLSISDDIYYRLRRVVRSWRVADARASGDIYRIKTARGMLTCHRRADSDVRGISEWIDQDTLLLMLDAVRAEGTIDHI